MMRGGGGYYYRVTSAITDDYIARSKLNGFIKRQHDILIDRNGGSAFFGQSWNKFGGSFIVARHISS